MPFSVTFPDQNTAFQNFSLFWPFCAVNFGYLSITIPPFLKEGGCSEEKLSNLIMLTSALIRPYKGDNADNTFVIAGISSTARTIETILGELSEFGYSASGSNETHGRVAWPCPLSRDVGPTFDRFGRIREEVEDKGRLLKKGDPPGPGKLPMFGVRDFADLRPKNRICVHFLRI
ncbi:hypothetical protein BDZ97DRAFT_1770459 [Flammula alnicola]|nr:hypothetical protein BDZ97DRAFT_1770459 [Flammula alnicola]